MSLADRILGTVLIAISISVFSYYTTWILILVQLVFTIYIHSILCYSHFYRRIVSFVDGSLTQYGPLSFQ